jgi:predicted DNA-binding protein
MTTMLSLRLSSEQEKRLTALASRHGMTRSEWLLKQKLHAGHRR